MSLKFCANLSFMFQEVGLLERYALASTLGFKGVECASPYEVELKTLVETKEKLGLEQILINVPVDQNFGYASLDDAKFMTSLKTAIDYARGLKCPMVHLMAGKNVKTPTSIAAYENNLKTALPLLSDAGLIGLIEPINSFSLPGYFMNDFSLAVDILNKIRSPNLKLQLDLFHLQILNGDLSRNIKNMFEHVGHIQIAQVPDRNEPDTPGEIDYTYVFDFLIKLGYKGWIGLEYTPKKGLGWIKNYGYSL